MGADSVVMKGAVGQTVALLRMEKFGFGEGDFFGVDRAIGLELLDQSPATRGQFVGAIPYGRLRQRVPSWKKSAF